MTGTYKDTTIFTSEELTVIYNVLDSYKIHEVTEVRVTKYDAPGLISAGTPYIVF